ncbi:MAG: secretin N-terminal domain-containing protein [Armatimonadota bacterium]
MKLNRYAAAFAALLVVQGSAVAQISYDDSAETRPWEEFRLDPKVRVQLDFRNANIDAILRMLSQASGVTIVKDPALTGGITVQSPRQQSLTTAFSLLNEVLKLKNFEMRKQGSFIIIGPRGAQQARQWGGRFGNQGEGDSGRGGDSSRGDQPEMRVYPIKYANATQIARVVNDVFVNSVNTANPAAAATAAAQAAAANQQRAGRGGRGGARAALAASGGLVRASADDFSNSLIVNAPRREHEQIARLLEDIDKQTEQPQQSRVFPVQFASAADLAPVIQNVLVSNAPRGRGGIGSQNVPIDQRFQQAARFGSSQAAFGTVAVEQRTNSLIVTATQDNLTIVSQLITELDKEVAFENSTFVVNLENARADVIAQLLNQSFGGRTGTGIGGGNTLGRTTAANRQRTTGANQQRPRQTPGATNRSQDTPEETPAAETTGVSDTSGGTRATTMQLALADPSATSGELATTVSVQQGRQNRQGQGAGRQQIRPGQPGATAPSGLDAGGRVVNVRDLTGQVVAVPDINTNSVIVVTSPENRELIEKILSQLDKIPEQVMIETLIVEASLDATSKLGVEWNFNQTRPFGLKDTNAAGSSAFGLRPNEAQPQGLRYTLTGTEYSVFLQALESDSRFEVLSTPRIFTSNNSTAEINISQSLPYVLNQRIDANGNLIFNYAFLDVGIILTVTPRITSNGYVTMDVNQTANDFVRYTEFNAPVVNQREAQTTVSVKDGETVVLGGIIKNSVVTTVNKVPLLGDIPILGNLFRSKGVSKNKTELLVFLTPRIVRDSAEARVVREQTEAKLEKKTQEKIKQSRIKGETQGDPVKPVDATKPADTAKPTDGPVLPTGNPAKQL